ncbi:hypothetical protein [Pararhodonellum marinum]|uniref:hypothetical protein n=1 Tax=Pararhodonellum marinum TaxID=2755358 RepID=UPI00188E1D68|nr:hypothetical protein [Pararhodonellum marinum]
MSITNKVRFLAIFLGLLIYQSGFSQTSTSTYSVLGLGEFDYSGFTHNQGMGGLGISFGDLYNINHVNPALTVKNAIFNFQTALNYQRINASTTNSRALVDGGGLNYVAMSLPVQAGKWSLGLGLTPLTSVNYSFSLLGNVENSELNSVNRVEGEGGITEAYLTSGIQVMKNLSLGFHGGYLFGSTIRTNQLTLLDPEGFPTGSISEYFERFTVSDITFKTGLYYSGKLKDQSYLNIGAIYQMYGDINGNAYAKIADFGNASNPTRPGDILIDNEKRTIFIPNKAGFGISYEKINKFVIGLEAQQQDFTSFRNIEGGSEQLGQAFKVGLGGQYIPDLFSIDNILARTRYRLGLEYIQTPYSVNGTQVNDIGINFGASVPVNNLSLMNVAVKLGTRGTRENGLVREDYFRISLGFSINDNTWFYKRVFE